MADPNAFGVVIPNPARRAGRYSVVDLKVSMRPFSHDYAIAVLRGVDDTDPDLWTTGTPIHIQWGRRPNQLTNFYGYVRSTSRVWSQTDRNQISGRFMTVEAIGASLPLRNGLMGSWANRTGADIAGDIGRQYRLAVDAPATSYLWAAKNAAGTSAWSFLCQLGRSDGVIVACNGTQIRYQPPDTILTRGTVPVPTFFEKDSGLGQTVMKLTTEDTEMSAVPGRVKAARFLYGLDQRTGASLAATTRATTSTLAARNLDPLLIEYPADVVVRDQAAAEAHVNAEAVENRFYIRAKATLAGDVSVVQESPVVLEGLGPRDSGLWQVISVTHHVRWQYFALEAELGRDSDYDTGQRPAAKPMLSPVTPVPASVLVNGVWQAASS